MSHNGLNQKKARAQSRRSTKYTTASVLVIGVWLSTGCAADTNRAAESSGLITAGAAGASADAAMTGEPSSVFAASPETTDDLGIVSWELYEHEGQAQVRSVDANHNTSSIITIDGMRDQQGMLNGVVLSLTYPTEQRMVLDATGKVVSNSFGEHDKLFADMSRDFRLHMDTGELDKWSWKCTLLAARVVESCGMTVVAIESVALAALEGVNCYFAYEDYVKAHC